MTPQISKRDREAESHAEGRARILLINDDGELSRYGNVIRRAGFRVQGSSTFAEGAQRIDREPYDLILLDQGADGFEGRKVLAKAMALDPELRVLVLGRSDENACMEAMQSGALDYIEGHLSTAEIVALLDTFMPSDRLPASTRGTWLETPDRIKRKRAKKGQTVCN